MRGLKPKKLLQTLVVSGFAVFAFGFNHLVSAQSSMAGVEGMSGQNSASAQCQTFCTTAIKPEGTSQIKDLEHEGKDTEPYFADFAIASLSLLSIVFVVKKLHLLSSWRPPDRTLLFGHYADGL